MSCSCVPALPTKHRSPRWGTQRHSAVIQRRLNSRQNPPPNRADSVCLSVWSRRAARKAQQEKPRPTPALLLLGGSVALHLNARSATASGALPPLGCPFVALSAPSSTLVNCPRAHLRCWRSEMRAAALWGSSEPGLRCCSRSPTCSSLSLGRLCWLSLAWQRFTACCAGPKPRP